MCIRILMVDVLSALAVWAPDDISILVKRGSDPQLAMDEVRAILADLSALPAHQGVPTCFCGDPVPLPPDLAAGSRRCGTHSIHHVWQVPRGA